MGEKSLTDVKGLLLDLDGVLYVGNQPIDRADQVVEWLSNSTLEVRYCTNTTVCSLASLIDKLHGLGLPVPADSVFGTIRAAVTYLRKQDHPRCHFLVSDDPRKDFAEFETDDTTPDYVVIGDTGKNWDSRLMQRTFDMVLRGAQMVALHKGRYWQTNQGLRLDIGAFVAGLEYATGKTATVIGKPSPAFFNLALDDMGLRPEQVAMIGDDINSDIGGAQAVGMKGVLVKSGKYRSELVAASPVEPDLIIDSVADFPQLLSQ